MAANLYAQESFVNATKGYRFGDSDPYETYCETPGELYRAMRREDGRCIGRVYQDDANGVAKAIGWVFVSRQRYEDARGNDPDDYYLREVWVTVPDAPDTVTRERHYHAV